MRKLFLPFPNIEDPKKIESKRGMGLGLKICKQVTEYLGGYLQAVSTPD